MSASWFCYWTIYFVMHIYIIPVKVYLKKRKRVYCELMYFYIRPHFRDIVRSQPITGLCSVFLIREDKTIYRNMTILHDIDISFIPISNWIVASLIVSRRDRYCAFCNNINAYCVPKFIEWTKGYRAIYLSHGHSQYYSLVLARALVYHVWAV